MQTLRRPIATMASLGLAIVFSTSLAAQEAEPNQQMMNMVLQLQQLQDEIRMLRGQIEEQAYELENLKGRQRDQYLDLDERINGLQNRPQARVSAPAGGVAAAGIPASSTGTGAAQPNVRMSPSAQPDVPDVDQRGAPPSAVTALASPEVESRTVAATPEMEQAAYDEAFKALKELRYADAAESFQDFLRDYPGSDLADNAQYWLGESYYVTRNYEFALSAFQTLIEQYPDSAKRGDGLLKVGFTHYELKQYDLARSALEQVQQQFPNSQLSRLADSRLRSMRVEGLF